MSDAASNAVRPNTATINAIACPSCRGLDVNFTSTEVQFASESALPIIAVNAYDAIANFTVTCEDPEGLMINTLVPNVSGAVSVSHLDMIGGAAIVAGLAGGVVSGGSMSTSGTAPGTATVTGAATFGAAGEHPVQWT